ncbi:Hypp319 [Branchiostoma lanceolatum]|uniref:Hypp319 protein n=1 Tax=Branchiostoma lanceolatum TaxID=7740 RepID=A0A8J9YQC6_BRALA|nr:Hypp319 [Branchiostoma lanceolatum]
MASSKEAVCVYMAIRVLGVVLFLGGCIMITVTLSVESCLLFCNHDRTPTGGIAVVVAGVVAAALSVALQWCSEVQHREGPSDVEDVLVHYTRLLPEYKTDSKRPSLETDTVDDITGQPVQEGPRITPAAIDEKLKNISGWNLLRDNPTKREGKFRHKINVVQLSPSYSEVDDFSFTVIDEYPRHYDTPDLCDCLEFGDEHGTRYYDTKRTERRNDVRTINHTSDETLERNEDALKMSSLEASQTQSHSGLSTVDTSSCSVLNTTHVQLRSGFKDYHAFQTTETAKGFETSILPPTDTEDTNENLPGTDLDPTLLGNSFRDNHAFQTTDTAQRPSVPPPTETEDTNENLPGLGQRRGVRDLRVIIPISHTKISLVPYTPTPTCTPFETPDSPRSHKSPFKDVRRHWGVSTLTADRYDTHLSV